VTHDDGYTVLEAQSPEIMGNVARQKLDEEHVHAPISETEDWVQEGSEAAIKRILYEAGYPVQDHRELASGEELPIDLNVSLRDYQQTWVDRFAEAGEGVFVGPPGSRKTVAAMGAMAHVEGETLVLVPSRDLAQQWADTIEEYTSLEPHQIGQYHGGRKEVRPVTIATYQIAGMDRHRSLFDDREWGLVIFDECQHVPSDVYRRSTHLQSKHRLGLSASPIREDDRQTEIFTLVGPPIGTDWEALFEAGFVAEPELEIRYVPWGDDEQANAYGSAEGREKYRIAAENRGKIDEVRYLLSAHPDAKAIVFVDYLDQGRSYPRRSRCPSSAARRHITNGGGYSRSSAGTSVTCYSSRGSATRGSTCRRRIWRSSPPAWAARGDRGPSAPGGRCVRRRRARLRPCDSRDARGGLRPETAPASGSKGDHGPRAGRRARRGLIRSAVTMYRCDRRRITVAPELTYSRPYESGRVGRGK